MNRHEPRARLNLIDLPLAFDELPPGQSLRALRYGSRKSRQPRLDRLTRASKIRGDQAGAWSDWALGL